MRVNFTNTFINKSNSLSLSLINMFMLTFILIKEAKDGYRNTVLSSNDPEVVKQRAMSDPEVQEILADPAMQLILQQMQKDPKALQE